VNPVQTVKTTRKHDEALFFLSYAHPSPLQGLEVDPDTEVQTFFADLSRELRSLVGLGEEHTVGFLDTQLPPGTDWNEARSQALSVAQVFIPLYSPTYFNNAWTLSELESFRARLKASSTPEVHRHVQPVLWDPLPPWEERSATEEALIVAPDMDAYTHDGLRALSRFSMYREEYRQVLGLIAAEVAGVSRTHPLAPSPAPPPTPEPIPRDSAQFVVVVAAPTSEELPPERDPAGYGSDATQWRPFSASDALPAAEYVASTAERLNLATYVTDFARVGDLLGTRPAVILIDPWILDGSWDERELATVLQRLPQWAIPVIALDDTGRRNDRGAVLAVRVEDILLGIDRPPAKQLHGLSDFVSNMPRLISEARHQYLKNAPVPLPRQVSSPRLRLITGGRPPEQSM
jgi:FxsC-like protein